MQNRVKTLLPIESDFLYSKRMQTPTPFSNTKSVWLSGEPCQRKGAYFSDICGHKIVKEFTNDDIFPRCPTCHQAVRWVRYNSPTRLQK